MHTVAQVVAMNRYIYLSEQTIKGRMALKISPQADRKTDQNYQKKPKGNSSR